MTPAATPAVAILEHLTRASIAIALMVAVAWIVCRLRPSLAPSTRSTIWWLVAAAALLRLAPIPALPLEIPGAAQLGAWLPAASSGVPAARPARSGPASPPGADVGVPMRVDSRGTDRLAEQPAVPLPMPTTAGTPSEPIDWRTPLVALWALIAAALLLRLALATRVLRRLAAEAEPVPGNVIAEVERLAGTLGLRRTPAVRISEDVATPQVVGLFRPIVLLPAAALEALTPRERAMTLCHELAHVRRLDLAFAWAPAVMERLLFFHPGARLAAREYAFAREAACDADVLRHLGEAPRDYGRLLLRLGVTRRPAAIAAAQSSPSTRLLRRRLAMLNDHVPAPRAGRALWLAGALLLPLALPLSLVARQADPPPPPAWTPAADAIELPPPPPAQSASGAQGVGIRPAAGVPGGVPGGVAGGVRSGIGGGVGSGVSGGVGSGIGAGIGAGIGGGVGAGIASGGGAGVGTDVSEGIDTAEQAPPPPPPPPPPGRAKTPPPPPPPPPPGQAGNHVHYRFDGGRDGRTIVLFDGEDTSVFSGSRGDTDEARRLRGGGREPFLYYRADGKTYTSRDRDLIERVRGELREQRELGHQQAALGHEQGRLGAEQAALGARHAAMGAHYAAAGQAGAVHEPRIHALESALAALAGGDGATTTELEAARKALREAIASLRRSKADAGAEEVRAHAEAMSARHRDVADEQRALGERQAELGRKQAELGRQQKEGAIAARERIRRILDEAAAAGRVQQVK